MAGRDCEFKSRELGGRIQEARDKMQGLRNVGMMGWVKTGRSGQKKEINRRRTQTGADFF